jgi:two-component system, LuxR family, sensor kinase FixL
MKMSEQSGSFAKEESFERRSLEPRRLSEALHRSIVTSAVDAILVIDDQAVIQKMNPAAERVFGYTGSEVVGSHVHALIPEFSLEHQDRSFEAVGRHKDGRMIPLEVSVSEVCVGNGRLFTVIGRDITERTKLENEIVAISWREQARIGQDLHDTVVQYLVGIQFMCDVLVERLAAKGLAETTDVRRIAELTHEALTLTRSLAKGLFPVGLADEALILALKEWSAQQEALFGVTILVSCPNPISIKDNTTSTHLFRIAQEAVSNAIRHGKARLIHIDLTTSQGTVSLCVKDDGLGLPEVLGDHAGMGLHIMSYRARIIGGSLSIKKAVEGGTVVVCSLPIAENGGHS